jgi:hypothetical protein
LIHRPSMGLLRRPTPGEIMEGGQFTRPCGPGALSRAISENPTCGCATIPTFHMTLFPDDHFGQQRRFWCYHPYGTDLARLGCGGPVAPRELRGGGDPTGDASQSWRPRGVASTASTARSASPRVCLTIGLAKFRLLGCPGTDPPLGPTEPGMEGGAIPDLRAIRRPRLRWIGTADHVIPPAAQLATARHAQAHLVKVDASTCR